MDPTPAFIRLFAVPGSSFVRWPSCPGLSLLHTAYPFQADVSNTLITSPPDFSRWCPHNCVPTPSPPARAVYRLTVSPLLTWHLCDVMVNRCHHVWSSHRARCFKPLCVWACCSLHLECPSLLSAKFWFIVIHPARDSLRDAPPACPSTVSHSLLSATSQLHSISFVFYECVCLLEIKYLYICLSH